EGDDRGAAPFEFTDEEEHAIAEALQRLEGFVALSEEAAEEIRSACTADALIEYAGSNVELFRSTGKQDSLERAVGAVAKAYSIYPVPIFIYHMAVLAEALGNRASASRLFRKFLDDQTVFQPSAVAKAVLKVRDVPGAVSYAALQNIAHCFGEGDYDGMAHAAKQAVHLSPDSAEAHYQLGNAYGLLNRYEDAEQELMRAASLNPSDDRPFYALGLLHLTVGHLDNAIQGFKEATRLNPQSDRAYFYLGEAYEAIEVNSIHEPSGEGDPCDNVRVPKKFSEMVGLFSRSLNRYSLARKAYEEAIRINPNYAQAHYKLGRIKAHEFSQLGFGLEEAIDCYKKAVELDPSSAEAQADLEHLLWVDQHRQR
ncbi:MAG: tetratricopeptide repeat protein, partial [Acidobacteria bacterium]|nr:tetratricopeptide repeat protein [Acidobacteriota bacterium]